MLRYMFIERSVFYHMIVFKSVCHIIRIYRLNLDVVGNVERSGHLSLHIYKVIVLIQKISNCKFILRYKEVTNHGNRRCNCEAVIFTVAMTTILACFTDNLL